jgi:hypothetical protein
MKKVWLTGQDPDQQKETRKHFANADILRSKLTKILDDKERETYNASLSAENYKSPSWAMAQADMVGFIRALKYVKSLIEDNKL